MQVPFPHPGFIREVYPGFLQLSGFMSMNLDRHLTAHHEFFNHLVSGDGDSAEKHRDFYDEYLAVMDLTAEFYLQTVETLFIDHALPRGEMMHRDQPIEPSAIRNTALLTMEGEKDDISGIGQTYAAHTLCTNPTTSVAITCRRPSATTAFSTGPGSVPKSRRASPISSAPTVRPWAKRAPRARVRPVAVSAAGRTSPRPHSGTGTGRQARCGAIAGRSRRTCRHRSCRA